MNHILPSLKNTGQINSYAAAKSLQSCPTLCDPIDGSPPGAPVPGILQARTLEWVAISFSNAGKWKVRVKSLSHVWLLATPRTGLQPTRLLRPWDFPGKSTGVGCRCLLLNSYRKVHKQARGRSNPEGLIKQHKRPPWFISSTLQQGSLPLRQSDTKRVCVWNTSRWWLFYFIIFICLFTSLSLHYKKIHKTRSIVLRILEKADDWLFFIVCPHSGTSDSTDLTCIFLNILLQ